MIFLWVIQSIRNCLHKKALTVATVLLILKLCDISTFNECMVSFILSLAAKILSLIPKRSRPETLLQNTCWDFNTLLYNSYD